MRTVKEKPLESKIIVIKMSQNLISILGNATEESVYFLPWILMGEWGENYFTQSKEIAGQSGHTDTLSDGNGQITI